MTHAHPTPTYFFLIISKISTGPFLKIWPKAFSNVNKGIAITMKKKRKGIKNTPPLKLNILILPACIY